MKPKSFISILCVVIMLSFFLMSVCVNAQPLLFPRELMIQYTPEWKGERFPDGRPKVPDNILERMKLIAIEEVWGTLRGAKYDYQFERGFMMTQPGEVLVGRAVTAMYMPKRTVVNNVINGQGKKDARIGAQVSWTIDTLQKGDVYVADIYRSVIGGPVIGGNLATAIFANSGNGVVFDGEVRDLEQIQGIKGFNCFIRGANPTYSWSSMLMGINIPIRIGEVTVMPGDVVLGKDEGVIFIPAHLAEKVCKRGEIIRLRDGFGFMRLREGKYTPGQIDGRWADEIEKDFSQWLEKNMDKLSVPKEQIQELLKERSW